MSKHRNSTCTLPSYNWHETCKGDPESPPNIYHILEAHIKPLLENIDRCLPPDYQLRAFIKLLEDPVSERSIWEAMATMLQLHSIAASLTSKPNPCFVKGWVFDAARLVRKDFEAVFGFLNDSELDLGEAAVPVEGETKEEKKKRVLEEKDVQGLKVKVSNRDIHRVLYINLPGWFNMLKEGIDEVEKLWPKLSDPGVGGSGGSGVCGEEAVWVAPCGFVVQPSSAHVPPNSSAASISSDMGSASSTPNKQKKSRLSGVSFLSASGSPVTLPRNPLARSDSSSSIKSSDTKPTTPTKPEKKSPAVLQMQKIMKTSLRKSKTTGEFVGFQSVPKSSEVIPKRSHFSILPTYKQGRQMKFEDFAAKWAGQNQNQSCFL